jgi:hypothetical protein
MALSLTTATDGALVTGLNNQSSGSFTLLGGAYSFSTVGTFSSTNIVLQQLGPDGSTWVNSFTPLTANGVQSPLYLPQGTFRFSGTSTSAAAAVQRIHL